MTRLVLCSIRIICLICLICHNRSIGTKVMFVSCLCRVRQRDFTQLHALCVSMCMPTCARYACGSAGTFTLSLSRPRALPRTTCMRQRGRFHSSTLKAARRHLGMSVCRRRRSAGLQRVEFVGVRVRVGRSLSGGPCLRSCGPAALRVWFVLSCCQRCMRTTWHHLCLPLCQPLR